MSVLNILWIQMNSITNQSTFDVNTLFMEKYDCDRKVQLKFNRKIQLKFNRQKEKKEISSSMKRF